MYDFIGDIHAHYTGLTQLFEKMRYTYNARRGIYTYPARTPVLLGDFPDGGPHNLRTIALARNMVEAGVAHVVMGNHNLNGVHFTMEDPLHPGEFLRPHNAKNIKQHKSFLEEVADKPEAYADALEWFKTLPLYLKLNDITVVHACWNAAAVEALHRTGALDTHNRLTAKGWLDAGNKRCENHAHIEMLLNGPEDDMGPECSFADAYGHPRTRGRLRWWVESPTTYGEAYNLPAHAGFADRPFTVPLGDTRRDVLQGMDEKCPHHVRPLLDERRTAPHRLTPRIACVDWSVSKKGGLLTAYRDETGAKHFNDANFVSVPSLG